MPILKAIFGAPQPTAPLTADTADLTDMGADELRDRLSELARQRRADGAAHAFEVEPLVAERARLERELAVIDERLSMAGITYTDRERARDHEVRRVQAELRARVVVGAGVDDDGEVPDERQVERLLSSMLSGKLNRNSVIASDASMSEACERYDQAEREAVAWVRHVAQTRSVTGRTPDMPASVERFNADLLRDLARRQGLSL